MKMILFLLALAGSVSAQISSLTLPHIIDSATIPKVSYVDDNDIALKNRLNIVIDSLNADTILTLLSSNSSLRLTLDADNNATGTCFAVTHNGASDTIAKFCDDLSARNFGALTVSGTLTGAASSFTNGTYSGTLGLTGPLLHGVASGDARLPVSTAGLFWGYSSTGEAEYDLHADGSHNAGWDAYRHSNDNEGPQNFLIKSRGVWGTETDVQTGDRVGDFGWQAYRNAGWRDAGLIRAEIAGLGASYVNSDLVFLLPSGSATPEERLRISAAGNVSLSATTAIVSSNTSDGSDNKRIVHNGGGGAGSARGSSVVMFGNEFASDPGDLILAAGNVSGGSVVVRTGADVDRLTISDAGTVAISGAATATSIVASGNVTADSLISSKLHDFGTFTGTLTGMTTSPTTTARWERVGQSVTICLDTARGTSNTGAFTITGMPSGLYPARKVSAGVGAFQDNNLQVLGAMFVLADGTIEFQMVPASFTSAQWGTVSWTSSGFKGLGASSNAVQSVCLTYSRR